MDILTKERFQRIKEIVGQSTTEIQRQTREEIFSHLIQIITTAKDDDHLYYLLWKDFPVWCTVFIDDDSGEPIFPARWQIQFNELIDKHNYVWALTTRKCGKSTILSLKVAHYLCGPQPKRIGGFAPTHGQDFVFQKVRRFLATSPYLYYKFIEQGGNLSSRSITTNNGSELINRSISITTGGSSIRGEYGDIVYVDEVQEVDQQIMDTVVLPMLADAYSRKQLIMVGTPNLYKNPHIQKRWNEWMEKAAEDPEYVAFTISWQEAVAEGCMNKKWIEDQKELMSSDDFAMEYEAKFPDTSLRFFPMNLLESLTFNPVSNVFYKDPKPEYIYIMAVDWAKHHDMSEILIGGYDRQKNKIHYCEWIELDPRKQKIDYEEQVEMVKKYFFHYDCKWICPDSTSAQDVLMEKLMTQTEHPPIPKAYIYHQETSDKPLSDVTRWGYKASDVSNWEMWSNHKQQMVKGRLSIPRNGPREERFYLKYLEQHHNLQARPIRSGALIKLEEKRGEYKDLAVTAAMMSLYLKGMDKPPASFYFGMW